MLKSYLKKIFKTANQGDAREESYYATLEELFKKSESELLQRGLIFYLSRSLYFYILRVTLYYKFISKKIRKRLFLADSFIS